MEVDFSDSHDWKVTHSVTFIELITRVLIHALRKVSMIDKYVRKKKYKNKLELQKSQMASYTLLAESSPNPTLHCHTHCLSGNH